MPIHGRMAALITSVPRFAQAIPGHALAGFCADMLRGRDGVGNGAAMPDAVMAEAVNATARKLKASHTDEQAIRNVLESQLRLKWRDFKTIANSNQAADSDALRVRPPTM